MANPTHKLRAVLLARPGNPDTTPHHAVGVAWWDPQTRRMTIKINPAINMALVERNAQPQEEEEEK